MVPFSPEPSPPDPQERRLLETYPAPGSDLAPPPDHLPLSADSYSELSRALIRLEEASRAHLLHAFNVTALLRLKARFNLPPDTT